MSGLAQQQASKCICIERSVQTERWFDCHRQGAMQSSKDTKGKEKALALSAFGWIEWTRTTDPHLIRVVL